MSPPPRNGGSAVEPGRLAVQHAEPERAEHLVPGEREEVHVQGGHVHRMMRHELRAVREHRRADLVRESGDLGHRGDHAGHVRLPGHRDDLRPLGDQRRVQVEPPLGQDLEPAQRRAGALGEQLPGHQVRVVLHLGDEDLVAGLDRRGERVGHQVDRLGGALGEHDLARVRAEERGDLRPRALVDLGALLAEQVGAAVRGAVVQLVEGALGVEDRRRLLRGRAGVQVDQRVVVAHRPGQDREIGPDRLDVEVLGESGHAGTPRNFS